MRFNEQVMAYSTIRQLPSTHLAQRLAAVGTILMLMVLNACTPIETRPDDDGKAPVATIEAADSLWIDQLIEGLPTYEAIAKLDNEALQRDGDQAHALKIRAAELAIEEETPSQVDARLEQLTTNYSQSRYHAENQILDSRIKLHRHQISEALAQLEPLRSQADYNERVKINNLRADALAKAGLTIDAVKIRIELDQQLPAGNEQQANDQQLWNHLLDTPNDIVSAHISAIPDTLSGWLELANLKQRNEGNATQLNEELDKWVARNPEHPANRYIIEQLKQRQIATSNHPPHIALLLPLTGRLAEVGSAVRDGFLSAYLETQRAFGGQIRIDVYDTAGKPENVDHALQQASQSGAQFVVGPLNKSAVKQAATSLTNQLPLLLLNQYQQDIIIDDELTPAAPESIAPSTNAPAAGPISDWVAPPTYQFTLAPETEALQAADFASNKGHDHALVIVPENVWGNRIYETFASRYESQGGTILSRLSFKKGEADYSSTIKQGLNLSLSNLRHQQLKSTLLKPIEFTPRRRQDIDMIFLAATAQEARQIKPQLKFFYADKIPVFATSHIYTGKPNPARDKDLEGVRFCDMPWVIEKSIGGNPISHTLDKQWPDKANRYTRFHALGADAFQLIPQLEWLQQNPNDWLTGYTGRIQVDAEGAIHRHLDWAIFSQGIPVPLQHAATSE